MLVVASANGRIGMRAAREALRSGGSALDAVEAGIRLVESDPDDHTVGLGGLPNLLGEVELDASIMDGRTLEAGAVGALQGFEHPITVARRVMEQLPHVMLVGAGAARFARELGFPEVELLTAEARRIWEEQGRSAHLDTDEAVRRYLTEMRKWAGAGADPERPSETVNFIARDRAGNLACGVSTSGWEWKYPGRLGDSPVIGAGNYADNRYGAAACTGRGEMAVRGAVAHSVVMALKYGRSLEAACREALLDLDRQRDPFAGPFSLIAVDRDGRHHAASNRPGRSYVFMTAGMTGPEEAPRVYVTR